MILLTSNEIVPLHEKMILSTGGSYGVRDMGLLESAVFSASVIYAGHEPYKTIYEKSARLAYSIIKNHPFIDGNKRTGIFVMLITLDINSIKLNYSQQEIIELGLGIADGSKNYEAILSWINSHLI